MDWADCLLVTGVMSYTGVLGTGSVASYTGVLDTGSVVSAGFDAADTVFGIPASIQSVRRMPIIFFFIGVCKTPFILFKSLLSG